MILKNILPQRLKDSLKVLLGRSEIKIANQESLFDCPICGSNKVVFDPLPFHFFRELYENQHIHPIFQAETINLEFYSCSKCQSNDRDRLYALYFDKILTGLNNHIGLLDIAPSPALTQFLIRKKNISVRTADLYMEGVDDRVDITNMIQYKDSSFDVFICSHVLEHIENDIKAMQELFRVTKPGGWGIAMVPINLGLKEVYEDDIIIEPADRWKHFGQDDHVRMYSKAGFIERLESVGFAVSQFGIDYFGVDIFKRYGIHPRSILYIASK
jgi:SAM-dependent methyltransferase